MKTRKILAWLLTFSLVLSLFACNKAEGITCPECDEECDADASFCPECGEKLNQTVECECGHENKAGSKFCSACGASLKDGNDKLDNNTNGDKENNDPENNDPENNDPGNNGQGDGEKEETPPDPAENIWLKVKRQYDPDEYSETFYEYRYNYEGLLVGEYYWYEGKCVESKEYDYDNDGKLMYYYFRNETGTRITSNYEYDESNNLISIIFSGGALTEYAYDESGNLISEKHFNQNGVLTEHTEYTYGKNGELVEEIEYDDDHGSRKRKEYENGKLKRLYYYNNGSNVVYSIYEYTYNEKGWVTEEIIHGCDDNGEIEGSRIEYSYEHDEYGNIIRENWQPECYGRGQATGYQYISLAEYRAQGLHNQQQPSVGDYLHSSQGGSGSGSGSGSSNQGTKCQHCKGGLLECSGCDGKGLVLKYYISGAPVYGNCMACKGNGYITCPHCGGDGIFGN